MEKDMTIGKSARLLLAFTLPLFIGNIFQQFYAMVDTIVVGRFLGVDALAAVGSIAGFSFMVVGFATGLAQGFGVLVAQRFGAKDEKGMRKVYTQGLLTAFFVTSVVSIFFYFNSLRLLRLINTPENIIYMANDYISVIYAFLISSVYYNFFSSVLRALGDSKSPVIFLLIASALNIFLDIFLILIIPLGVKGVAIATVISQGFSAFLSFFYIKRKFKVFKCSKEDWVLDFSLIKKLLSIGLPGALQFSVCAVGTIIVQASLNRFGSDAIASYSLGIKIENIITQFFPALGMAISTFSGQNLGAGKMDRIKDGFKKATLISTLYALFATLVTIIFARPISYIFVDKASTDPIVISRAVEYAVIVSLFYIPLGFIFVFRTGCQGLGSGLIPLASSGMELLMRVLTAFPLPTYFGFLGICLASPFAWIGAGFMLPFLYKAYLNRLIKIHNREIDLSYLSSSL